MRRLSAQIAALFLALVAFLPYPAAAQATDEARSDAVRSVISRQIEAFRRDDGAAAYSFASPSIQRIFPSPDIFMTMVRRGYPQVYRPQSVSFRAPIMEDGVLIQRVDLVGPDGTPVLARYEMQRQPDGSWKINGVMLEEVDDFAV